MEVEFEDLRRIHHEAGHDQRDPAWDQVFVTCMGCKLMIDIRGVPAHLVARIPDARGAR
jgi:hypothetical protein